MSYTVKANETTTERSATVVAAGNYHSILQAAQEIPVDFTVSPSSPEIGEEVTFSVTDTRLTPTRWELGGTNCEDTGTVYTCNSQTCDSITWKYAGAGWKSVRLVTNDGRDKSRGVLVQASGICCLKYG